MRHIACAGKDQPCVSEMWGERASPANMTAVWDHGLSNFLSGAMLQLPGVRTVARRCE